MFVFVFVFVVVFVIMDKDLLLNVSGIAIGFLLRSRSLLPEPGGPPLFFYPLRQLELITHFGSQTASAARAQY